ncbi:MAG: biotin/lipoyl-containing protein [Candidatus Dormibacteria bacterium]
MNQISLIDTSLRWGQEALLVSRLRTRHAVQIARALDGCGFAALDVMGSAAFEASLRFLGEDPFERLSELRAAISSTPMMVTLGGQVGFSHHHLPDDVINMIVKELHNRGVDWIRVYDSLNNLDSVRYLIEQARHAGQHVDGFVVYNPTSSYTTKKLAATAKAMSEAGCERITVYDPLGVLSEHQAKEVVATCVKQVGVPCGIASSMLTGIAPLAYAGAIDAGATFIDTCLPSLSSAASAPAVEPVIHGLESKVSFAVGDTEARHAAEEATVSILGLYEDVLDPFRWRHDTAPLEGALPVSSIPAVLEHLQSLEELSAERLAAIAKEAAAVSEDMGEPGWVTPLREIIAMQATYNIVEGDRYVQISQEIKDYFLGLYGHPLGKISSSVERTVNGMEEPITCRPADVLEPGIPQARKMLSAEDVPVTDASIVMYAMYPNLYIAFARGELIPERLPDDVVEEEEEPASESAPETASSEGDSPIEEMVEEESFEEMTVEVDGETYHVRILERSGVAAIVEGSASPPSSKPASGKRKEGTVVAPMQGLILKVHATVGAKVKMGDVVAVLEAMKMQNDIVATRDGIIKDVYVKEGSVVKPDDPVVLVE